MKKYVLTGGPGSGKSSIVLALEYYYGEYVVREAAEDYIRLKQAEGDKEPWLKKDFQEEILGLQLQRERAIPPDIRRAFLDRSRIDGLDYEPEGTETYAWLEKEAKDVRYDKIFLIKHIGATEKTDVRRENNEQALALEQKMIKIYTDLGYELITVPEGTVEWRVEFILKSIGLPYFTNSIASPNE